MATPDTVGGDGGEPAVVNKPKRVRTGCLTCRERHLKCDEGLPNCVNCRKSNRPCKRGIRLNFIDITVKDPYILPPTPDWNVTFLDESREIASEYKGGLSLYKIVRQAITPPREPQKDFPTRSSHVNHTPNRNDTSLPPIQTPRQHVENGFGAKQHEVSRHLSITGSDNSLLATPLSASGGYPDLRTPSKEPIEFLTIAEDILFMQVFVEEVAVWMDSMDTMKHFSRILPFHGFAEPMLRNAFLACGARHLTLVNPVYHGDRALYYYDTATTQLLRSLQNPDRDTICCATTAVVLNVYEIMSERAMQRMNHIAGARALIKECGWNARSTGVGAACFWLNIGMELLSCLHFNWQIAWDPDQWGVDMDFKRESELGQEDGWVHRMVYIVGKIANFRATIPRFQEASPHDENARLQSRLNEWHRLKGLCESWDQAIPRTMHPMGFLHPGQTSTNSSFPEVWLIKRVSIIGRLFYHTAMCLLPQINPIMGRETEEMKRMELEHAHMICGIVAHVKDRGVASVALRSLAIAAECLTVRREQEEVLEIFEKIRKETGWRVGFINEELKVKWGWRGQEDQQKSLVRATAIGQLFPNSQATLPPAPPPVSRPLPSGILNPLLARADFSLPNHPYQQYYQPPSLNNTFAHSNFNISGL